MFMAMSTNASKAIIIDKPTNSTAGTVASPTTASDIDSSTPAARITLRVPRRDIAWLAPALPASPSTPSIDNNTPTPVHRNPDTVAYLRQPGNEGGEQGTVHKELHRYRPQSPLIRSAVRPRHRVSVPMQDAAITISM